MKRLFYIIILILFSHVIACAQSKWCLITGNESIDTSRSCCNYTFFGFHSWKSYLRNRKCIDTVIIGNIHRYYDGHRNSSNNTIMVKSLSIISKFSIQNSFVRLGGISNLISYFSSDYINYPPIPNLKYYDTLDIGDAKKIFIRSFQLPVVKKMKVIRHHRLDTILTNDSADYIINFHGRRVFVKTYLRYYQRNK